MQQLRTIGSDVPLLYLKNALKLVSLAGQDELLFA